MMPCVPLHGCSSQDMLMLRCQQHLARIVAATPSRGGFEPPLPMLTRMGSVQPPVVAMEETPAAPASRERTSTGVTGPDHQGTRCIRKQARKRRPSWQETLADELAQADDLGPEFWHAQSDLSSALSELAGGALEAGQDLSERSMSDDVSPRSDTSEDMACSSA